MQPISSALDLIPDTAGVYLFYQSPDTLPLYIGKSIHLKQRVKSHFLAAKTQHKEQQIISRARYIDWQLTAGEISALLLESQLVKQHLPIFNRRLRRHKNAVSIVLQQYGDFLQPSLTQQALVNFVATQELYGLFRTLRQANQFIEQLINECTLCRKALGLEKSRSSCFNYQLKKCHGACIGAESAQAHNQRLLEALQHYQHQRWPYPGKILLKEHCPINQLTTTHVIDHWIYYGTVQDPIAKAHFDLDIYRILSQVFRQPQNFDITAHHEEKV